MSAVAKRYARAAVAAAEKAGGQKAIEELAVGLVTFRDACEQSSALLMVVQNPTLKVEREPALKAVLKHLGASDLVTRLVLVLGKKDRFDILADLTAEVQAVADERAGRLRAKVKTAAALSDAQVSRLGRALEKRFGRPVVMSVEVEPELLGGVVCQLGDATFDTSVLRQLTIMQDRLLA